MVSKKLLFVALFSIVFISLISAISAEIMISQPKALYNLGDDLSVEVKLGYMGSGYMDVDLRCDGKTINLYHNVPEATTISFNRKLIPEYIGTLQGSCDLYVNYDNQNLASQLFQISSDIDINLQTVNLTYEAGKAVKIKGQAYLKNNMILGQIYPAYIEVSMTQDITKKDVIKDGQFDVEFLTPENLKAGSYPLTIKIYDEDDKGNILNNKDTMMDVAITQKPARVDIAIDKSSLVPGENLSVIPFIYDYAGEIFNDKVLVRVKSADAKVLYEGYTDSGANLIVQTDSSNLPGDYTITAESNNLNFEKTFQIQELKQISAEIINDTLAIKNTGNVRYTGVVQVQIGGQTINQEIDLDVGEKRVFALSAPDGAYDVSLKTDKLIFSQTGVPLTGNAISMSDLKSRIENIWADYPLVWIFIGIVIVLLLLVLIIKMKKKRKFYAPSNKDSRTLHEIKRKGGVEVIRPGAVADKIISGEEARKAEQVLVLHGSKHPASIIAIKTKGQIAGIAKQSFDRAIEQAYKKKAVSYSSGDYTILIFSPLITKNIKNEEPAIRAAIDIDKMLAEHNRKFRNDIIRYGIGVNCGEIINKMEGKILQFTSIDKTIINTKRIADVALDEVLLSKEIHSRTMNNIKADKFTSGAMELFKIKRVVDTEKSKKFIEDFMRRN